MENNRRPFRLSSKQRDRASEFFVDLAKLLVGSAFVPFVLPQSVGGAVDIPTFIGGTFLALLCLAIGLKLVPSSGI